MPTGSQQSDVVVVGAGLAGLTAARDVNEAGADVTVLEARERVGGRTLSTALAGEEVVDLGAQWIGPGQDRIQALVDDLDLETFPQYEDGLDRLGVDGDTLSATDTIEALPLHDRLNLYYAIWRLETLRERVDLERPWETRGAARLDEITLGRWKRRHLKTSRSRDVFDAIVRALFTSEPSELSFLYFLYYLHAGGGFESLVSTEGGAQQSRIEGGTQQIAEALAAPLDESVHLEAPVRSIAWDDEGVTVTTDGGTFAGRYAIVAVPPTMAGRIAYDPPLPAARDALTQRMPMGDVVKCVAAYESPFWRAAGYSGGILDADGVVGLAFDDSPPDGQSGALVGFILGERARTWSDRDSDDRRDRVLAEFADHFGGAAADPIAYVDRAWSNERWSGGCYAGNMGPGTMTALGEALREPVGPIHWAGTETAAEWYGYMDGAVRSGERAAREVTDRLDDA